LHEGANFLGLFVDLGCDQMPNILIAEPNTNLVNAIFYGGEAYIDAGTGINTAVLPQNAMSAAYYLQGTGALTVGGLQDGWFRAGIAYVGGTASFTLQDRTPAWAINGEPCPAVEIAGGLQIVLDHWSAFPTTAGCTGIQTDPGSELQLLRILDSEFWHLDYPIVLNHPQIQGLGFVEASGTGVYYCLSNPDVTGSNVASLVDRGGNQWCNPSLELKLEGAYLNLADPVVKSNIQHLFLSSGSSSAYNVYQLADTSQGCAIDGGPDYIQINLPANPAVDGWECEIVSGGGVANFKLGLVASASGSAPVIQGLSPSSLAAGQRIFCRYFDDGGPVWFCSN